jgi:hypothetical protein
MNAIIEIDAPQLLTRLRAELEAGGCATEPFGECGCRVVQEQALEAEDAYQDLGFFMRAWARSHGGVGVRLRPEL